MASRKYAAKESSKAGSQPRPRLYFLPFQVTSLPPSTLYFGVRTNSVLMPSSASNTARAREGQPDAEPHHERQVEQPFSRLRAVEIPDGRAVEEHDRRGREEEQRQVQQHQVLEALVVADEQEWKLQQAR